ncbi:MAG: hypothetical protein HY553_03055 [Elusimicrobia bacterium]|nr:hypothetical protein [Elusimicrobiota bacterium]
MGCAVSRLSKRPSKKNLGILDVGTPRSRVIAELGTPGATSDKAGEKVDSFAFDPGVSGGMKFARGFFHVGADLFTLFLWELVAWPSEIAAGDSKKKIDVAYDLEDRVKTVTDWTKGR